jgi:hypothetical protein
MTASTSGSNPDLRFLRSIVDERVSHAVLDGE